MSEHTRMAGERTRDIYECSERYPQPPLAPLPPPDEEYVMRGLGITPTPLARRLFWGARAASGFTRFRRELPGQLEQLLRTSNLRGAYLFAPVVAATVALADDPRPLDALDRAASLVIAAQQFYADLVAGRLQPDAYRGRPLEMGLYRNLFGTSLVIENGDARLFKSANTATIAVVVGGRILLLELGPPEPGVSFAALRAALAALVAQATAAPRAPDEPAPGLLTAAEHPTQLRGFGRLQQQPVNAESLALLRHTFLTLCLDLEAQPGTLAEAATLAQIGNCANRWFHASLQIVVFGNRRACTVCNFNAYLDGNTMMRATAELQRRGAACPIETTPTEPLPPARPLAWRIEPSFAQQAERELAQVRDDQGAIFTLTGYGRAFFAAHNADPVPTFILALQLATARLLGEPSRVTQFLSMSKYRSMDLTTAEVTTPETRRFVAAMLGGRTRVDEARALFGEATRAQTQVCRVARQSLPFDDLATLFLRTRTPAQQLRTALLHGGARLLLRALRLQRMAPREVLVSHPEIYPEAPLVGRPGVRLPYLRHFGLHYQIWADETVVIVMPAVDWSVPNSRLIDELRAALDQIGAILAGSTTVPEAVAATTSEVHS